MTGVILVLGAFSRTGPEAKIAAKVDTLVEMIPCRRSEFKPGNKAGDA